MPVGEMPGAAQLNTTQAKSAALARVVTLERRLCTIPLQQPGPPRNHSPPPGFESSIGRSRVEFAIRAGAPQRRSLVGVDDRLRVRPDLVVPGRRYLGPRGVRDIGGQVRWFQDDVAVACHQLLVEPFEAV